MYNSNFFRIKWWKNKVHSRDREKVSGHLPQAFISFMYLEKMNGQWKRVYRCQMCYYKKSVFSKLHIDYTDLKKNLFHDGVQEAA